MNRWSSLHSEIDGGRALLLDASDVVQEIRSHLSRAVASNKCPKNTPYLLTTQKGRDLAVITFARGTDPVHPPHVSLNNLARLPDGARLSLLVNLSGRRKKSVIRSYSVVLKATQDDAWYVRIDLTAAPEGQGLCGHPLLHCHVGLGSPCVSVVVA